MWLNRIRSDLPCYDCVCFVGFTKVSEEMLKLPKGLLFMSAEATEACKRWDEAFAKTSELIMAYLPLLLFYVKAFFRTRWQTRVKSKDIDQWTPRDVLDEMVRQRSVLYGVGAATDLFEIAAQLKQIYEDEPTGSFDRHDFCDLTNRLIDAFPFNDLRILANKGSPNPCYAFLNRIEPNYYRSEHDAMVKAALLKDFLDAYRAAEDAEVRRLHTMTIGDHARESYAQAGIPEDVDSDDDWFIRIFMMGYDAAPVRERVLQDVEKKRQAKENEMKASVVCSELEEEVGTNEVVAPVEEPVARESTPSPRPRKRHAYETSDRDDSEDGEERTKKRRTMRRRKRKAEESSDDEDDHSVVLDSYKTPSPSPNSKRRFTRLRDCTEIVEDPIEPDQCT